MFSASVTDTGANATGVYSVQAMLYQDGLYLANIGLPQLNGSTYGFTYGLTANTGTASHVYTALITATDVAGNTTTATAVGSCTQTADNQPPVISAITLTPSELTATGGNILFTATVTDSGGNNTGVSSVAAQINRDGYYWGTVNLTNTNGGSVYSYTYAVPSTTDRYNHSYTGIIIATDRAGNSSSAAVPGSVLQRSDYDAGAITAASVTPANVPVAGGTLTVTATITGSGMTAVAQIYLNGQYHYATIPLTNGGSGTSYSGSYSIPATTADYVSVYTATVFATDATGLASSQVAVGQCTQPAGAGTGPLPVISNAQLTPAVVPVAGGSLVVAATVTTTAGVTPSVSATLYQDGIYYTYNYLTLGTGNSYTCNFAIPANTGTTGHPYTATVTASDAAHSNTVAAAGAAVQQDDDQPPTISSATISCPGITAAGNTLLITATVVDNGAHASGVNSVTAYIYNNGDFQNFYNYVTLTNNGSGNSYSGTFMIPANNGDAPIVWSAAITASDYAGNTTNAPVAGSVTQPNDNTPPTITNATLLPASRPAGGGTLLLQPPR